MGKALLLEGGSHSKEFKWHLLGKRGLLSARSYFLSYQFSFLHIFELVLLFTLCVCMCMSSVGFSLFFERMSNNVKLGGYIAERIWEEFAEGKEYHQNILYEEYFFEN